ncbi:MAG: hypothetical protein K5829_05375 [Treponema sp.]|nr:hypothetical protein [Treponema sp.]
MRRINKFPKLSFLTIVGVLFLCAPAFSAEKYNEDSFLGRADIFTELTPSILLNTASKTFSAPSPSFFPLSLGLIYPNDTSVSFEPSLSFFWTNYLIYEEEVYPAEIENRTATALSFLFEIPVAFSLKLLEKNRLKLIPGFAFLIRIPILANGVSTSDSGWYGSAKDDVSHMGLLFYEKGRFFYLSFKSSWIFEQIEGIRFGPVISVYFPIISAIADKSLNGMIFEAGLQLIF